MPRERARPALNRLGQLLQFCSPVKQPCQPFLVCHPHHRTPRQLPPEHFQQTPGTAQIQLVRHGVGCKRVSGAAMLPIVENHYQQVDFYCLFRPLRGHAHSHTDRIASSHAQYLWERACPRRGRRGVRALRWQRSTRCAPGSAPPSAHCAATGSWPAESASSLPAARYWSPRARHAAECRSTRGSTWRSEG